jgi:transposase-like protein
MMLLIATGIDANDNALPLSWAIVPTENEKWWLWFCSFLKEEFDPMSEPSFVFMSDREKGISVAVSEEFPSAFHGKCCQHIADNIQQRYGMKCRPLFWKYAYAKTEAQFKVCKYILGIIILLI